jgi:predicted GIY-YIG superfamily endonuclease
MKYYSFQLPITDIYEDFVNKYEKLKKVECVYKIYFTSGDVYIGKTSNLVSRIYNHLTLNDSINCKTLTEKHIRIKDGINKNEIVTFSILSNNLEHESLLIKKQKENKHIKCLNMRNH